MTKFMNFNPDKPNPGKKSTRFIYEIATANPPIVEETERSPENFDNVVHLYYDKSLEFDVFMAWNEDITNAWIFYGTKGDEFE